MGVNKTTRRKKGRWAGVPHRVLDSENYKRLNGWDVRLLLDLSKQYNGNNNGDLSAAFNQFKDIGWRSSGTLNQSLKNLIKYGFIQKTRQGGKNHCSLYALTWEAIDDCKGKIEVRPTKTASNLWQSSLEN